MRAATPLPTIGDYDRWDRNAVETYLIGKHWRTAQNIAAATGITPLRMRQLCQLFPTTFISSTEGYKHVASATKDEILHCVQSLIARAEKITHRASALAGTL